MKSKKSKRELDHEQFFSEATDVHISPDKL